MSFVDIAILATIVLINFVLVGFVYVRNPGSATHRLFAIQTIILSLYLVTNFLAVTATAPILALWSIRAVMFFAAPTSTVFFFFMHTFPSSNLKLSRRSVVAWTALTAVAMLAAASPFLFTSVEIQQGGVPQPVAGPAMLLFIPAGVLTIPLGIYYLVRKTIRAKGIARTQSQFMLLGVAIMFVLILSLIFIGTVAFGNSGFARYAPVFTLPFTLLASYTIIRHRLMDIRLAIARSLSLSILVGAFLLIYAAMLIFAIPVIADFLGLDSRFVAAVGALASVVLARFIQDTLRRVTDRFLFQGQTDYAAALADISNALSRTIQIDEVTVTIIHATREIIRAESTLILIKEPKTGEFKTRATDGQHKKITIPAHNPILEHAKHATGPIIKDEVARELEEASKAHVKELEELMNTLEWLDAAVVLPLLVNNELTGIIVLGPKLSGSPYLKQDADFFAAFTPQAATALENARLYKESLEFGAKLKKEVKRATAELAAANEQLKDIDKAKSEFLSIASHQLYTPLTALKGYISMIQEGDFGKVPTKQKPILDILQKSGDRLITLIKGLLDISRIESGRLELNLESTNLARMAEELVEDLLPNALTKKLDLEFMRPPRKLPNVVADQERIRQVMLNFIDNAIKYTETGRVEVRVQQEGDELVFSVEDTGKGLAPEEVGRLFNKFTRVGGAARFHTEGTGLGLYVAKQIVNEHHGTVTAKSLGKGKGSMFLMHVPIEGSKNSLKEGQHTTVEIKAT